MSVPCSIADPCELGSVGECSFTALPMHWVAELNDKLPEQWGPMTTNQCWSTLLAVLTLATSTNTERWKEGEVPLEVLVQRATRCGTLAAPPRFGRRGAQLQLCCTIGFFLRWVLADDTVRSGLALHWRGMQRVYRQTHAFACLATTVHSLSEFSIGVNCQHITAAQGVS